ncbi:MAG: MMPL family transporter, partial [Myxococcales bacterium]|nr:MMPL family transporter [Myxococcales bacterium]
MMPNLDAVARWLAERVTRNPKRVVLATALVALAWVGLAAHAAFSTDYRIFFAPEDPRRQALEHAERLFTRSDNIAFLVAPHEGEVFTQDALRAVDELTKAGWKLPFAGRVDSVTNFQHARLVPGDEEEELVVGDLVPDVAALDAAGLTAVRATALAEPVLAGSLVAKDAGAAGVNVTLRLPGAAPDEVVRAARAARALAHEVAARHPDLEIRVSGMAMMNEAFMAASIEDMSSVFPLMGLAMVGLLWLLLGSGAATASALAVVLFAALSTLGAAPIFGYPLTPPSAAAPTIVLTLAMADAVHIIVSTNRLILQGRPRRVAVEEALVGNFEPVLFTSLTTMVGFLCLNFAEAPPFAHLANMTATGVVMALLASVTFLPALLVLVPLTPTARAGWGDRAAQRLSRFVLRARRPLAVGGVALSLGLGVAATTLESNDQFLQYFDDSISFRPDTERFMEELTGIYTMDFAVPARGGAQVTDPAYLADMAGFAAWLRAQPEVLHVYTVTDTLQSLSRLLGDGAMPKDPQLTAQYLLLYEMSLPFGLDLNDRVSLDRSTLRVTVTLDDLSSGALIAFADRSEAWLTRNAPHAEHAAGISPALVFSHLAERNTAAMMRGNLLTLVLISLCLMFVLRSFGVGLLSLIPNVMPIVATYGVWALVFGEINIVASVAGAIALGIIVDDTIHVLSKYQRLRRSGREPEAAAQLAVASAGPALVVTTCVLLVGFAILSF